MKQRVHRVLEQPVCFCVLVICFVFALTASPAHGQNFLNRIAAAPQQEPGIDCDFFFPEPLRPQTSNPKVLGPYQQALLANQKARHDMEPSVNTAFTALQQAKSKSDLETRLQKIPVPQSVTQPQLPYRVPLWPARARLWAACQRWEHSNISYAMFDKYFLLMDVYNDWVVNGPKSWFPPCSVEPALPDNAIRTARMWTEFNNRLYNYLFQEATQFDFIYGYGAEAQDLQLPAQDSPNVTQCQILARGPVNDTAAVRWMVAEARRSMNNTAPYHAALNELLCVRRGKVYNKRIQDFWQPGLTVPPNHHCPRPGH